MIAVTTLFARRRRLRRRGSEGFTLIELLVSMSIFAVLLAVMMSVVISMTKSLNKTQSIGDAAAQGLRATQALDKELRYADFVNQQVTGASGDQYVSFEGLASSAATNPDVSMCYQWRLHTGGLLQQRSWQQSITPTSSVTATSPTWTTVATGVVNGSTSPVFAVNDGPSSGVLGSTPFKIITIDLVLQGKSSSVGHAETKLQITARNSNYPPGSVQCNAVTP
jgi:prepilin-type N-terminal cleavage/methylation domain-containing protein